MARVIVLDTIAPEGLAVLEQAGISYDIQTGLKGDALRAKLASGYEGAICRSGVKITADALQGNRTLKAIVRAGVGTDNIDKTAATRQGVIVMNTPAGNTLSTAEHAFALMLALSRNIAPAYETLKSGKWERNAFMGTQLADKTLGVVGLGRIGQEVAKRARAFQMRVLGVDPYLSPDQAQKLGIELVPNVHAMLPLIDYLTVHTPLTAETENLIGPREVAMLKKGCRLINAARGGIYDEAALVEGLSSGQIGGVALDVFLHEPCTASPLFGMKNVLCTPHLGASTEEAQTLVAVEAAHLLVNYLTKGEIRHAVNAAALDPQTLDSLRGFLVVAYRLGRLLSQWHESPVKSCSLRYRGEVAKKDTRFLTSAFCAGLLEGAVEEVNVINAEMLLREVRGIQLTTHNDPQIKVFSSSISAQIASDGGTCLAEGTLFGHGMPRLVKLDNYRLESYLDGHLIIFAHDDVPGIIGNVGTACAKYGVNIAQMAVGRETDTPGGNSIGVLQVDGLPPQAALEEIRQVQHIRKVWLINLPKRDEVPSWMRT